MKYCVLASNGTGNSDADHNKIIFIIKDMKLSQRTTIKNYQNFLAKDLKDQCIGMNLKQKVRVEI